jgi:hypothetical protein
MSFVQGNLTVGRWAVALLLVAGASMLSPNRVSATGYFLEHFDYTTGPLAGSVNPYTGNTWTATGADVNNPLQVSGPSLSYPGITGTAGSAMTSMTQITGYQDVINDFGTSFTFSAAGEKFYYSCIINNETTMSVGGGNPITVTPTGVGTLRARLYIRQGTLPEHSNFGIGNATGNQANVNYDTVDYPNGTPVFVVLSYNQIGSTGGVDDTCSLWINPPLNAAEPSPTKDSTDFSIDMASVASLYLRQNGANNGYITIDEIRAATTWAEVTASNVHLPSAGVFDWSTY